MPENYSEILQKANQARSPLVYSLCALCVSVVNPLLSKLY